MVGNHKSNCHIMFFYAFWAYRTSLKYSILFTSFQLVHGVEVVVPIECEIHSLKLVVELLPNTSSLEKSLIHLAHFDEKLLYIVISNENIKKHVKT